MDTKTQQDIRLEMLYGEIKDIDDYEFEFPSMVQKKKYLPVALNEKWKHPGHLKQMWYMSNKVFRATGKGLKKD